MEGTMNWDDVTPPHLMCAFKHLLPAEKILEMAEAQARAEVLEGVLRRRFGLNPSLQIVADELSHRPDPVSVLLGVWYAESVDELLGPRENWQLSFLDHYVNVLESAANCFPIDERDPVCDEPEYAAVHRPTVWKRVRAEMFLELLRERFGAHPELSAAANLLSEWRYAAGAVWLIINAKSVEHVFEYDRDNRPYRSYEEEVL
jgi:hypothetical protein